MGNIERYYVVFMKRHKSYMKVIYVFFVYIKKAYINKIKKRKIYTIKLPHREEVNKW